MLPTSLQAAVTAKLAGEVRGFDLCVLIRLWDLLDVFAYRALKLHSLQMAMRTEGRKLEHPKSLRRAIRRLEVLGFIERGPRDGKINTYRLAVSPAPRTALLRTG